MLRREGTAADDAPVEIMQQRYELLGMQDMFLDFAGRRPLNDAVHQHLAALQPGSLLTPRTIGERVEFLDRDGLAVAMLSRSAAKAWLRGARQVNAIRVVAMLRREIKDSGEEFRQYCHCDTWEVPWLEVVFRR
jgi:ATP-dependent DNA helicase RecQ